MGHSSLVDCSGGQAMSSITTNCGQDANQVSHERLRDVRIPEGRAVLLGSEEIDREHLESYAICMYVRSISLGGYPSTGRSSGHTWREASSRRRTVFTAQEAARHRATASDTTGCCSTAIGARSRAAGFTILPPSNTLFQERHFVFLSGSKTQSRRSRRAS